VTGDEQTIAALQARLSEFGRREEAWQQQEAALRQQLALYQLVLDTLPTRIFWKRAGDLTYLGCNRAFAMDGGRATTAELIGLDDYAMVWADQADAYRTDDERVIRSGEARINYEEPQDRPDGTVAWVRTSKMPLIGADGVTIGVLGAYEDVTAQRRADIDRLAEQERLIQIQQETLRELSTPLIPLAEGIVAMPIVGAIDTRRATQIMETLLEGITQYQADIAVLDISGVRVVDTQVADALLRAARAAKLLGTQIVLTGISAEVALTMVHLGAELSGVSAQATLREGLLYAEELRIATQQPGAY
jgi:PAS domain S-box-containing protein